MDLLRKDDILLKHKYGVLEDPDFSAKRNKQIIEGTIKKTELRQQQKQNIYGELLRERSEAVASFLKHVDKGKHNDVVKYFGRQELARLRGEDIANQIKARLKLNAKA